MKLTKQDKTQLLNWGYTEEDFPQIEMAIRGTNTCYTLNDTPIDRAQAISLLGREVYLSGIARSTFHWSAVQETDDGHKVYFDSRLHFQSQPFRIKSNFKKKSTNNEWCIAGCGL